MIVDNILCNYNLEEKFKYRIYNADVCEFMLCYKHPHNMSGHEK